MNKQQTLTALQASGLIAADATIDSNALSNSTPWYLQLFFGLSGVLASLLFLAFLTLLLVESNIFASTIGIFIVGAVLSATSGVMFRYKPIRNSVFWQSLTFAIGGAGQIYIAIALFMDGLQPAKLWLFLLLQILLTLTMVNIVYRLLSSAVALGCMVYLLSYYGIPEFSLALLALIMIVSNMQRYVLLQRAPHKARLAAFEMSQALAYSSAIVLLNVSVYFIVSDNSYSFGAYKEAFDYNYYLSQTLLTLVSLYGTYLILRRYHLSILSAIGLLSASAALLLGVMSIYVSGLLATSLVIVIAMANSQRVLLGVGIFALVGYIFWYYYQLDTSLLIKSISMLVIGIGLLMMRWFMLKRYTATGIVASHSLDKKLAHLNASDEQERLS